MNQPPMPDIFGCEDYREWLREWFLWKKEIDPTYSYRKFGAECDQSSSTILEAVAARRRNLTVARAAQFLGALGLPPRAASRFRLLVLRERLRATPAGPGVDPETTPLARVQAELDGLDAIEAGAVAGSPVPADVTGLVAALGAGQPFVLVQASSNDAGERAIQLLRSAHVAGSEVLGTLNRGQADARGLASRFLGVTQAIPHEQLPRVIEEISGLHRRLLARYAGAQGGAYLVCADAFPLSRVQAQGPPAQDEAPTTVEGEAPVVFDFPDARGFVTKWFEWKRTDAESTGERFSLQVFADQAGLRDRTQPNKIIAGKQGLTEIGARAFARGMGLPPEDEEFFVLLAMREGGDDVERRALDEEIRTARVLVRARMLRVKALRLFSAGYYLAIHELAWCQGMPASPAAVAGQLLPAIAPEEAARAIDTLLDLGLVVRGDDGRLHARDAALIATMGVQPEALRPAMLAYHREMQGAGGRWLDALRPVSIPREPPKRGRSARGASPTDVSFSCLGLRLPDDEVPRLQEMLNNFAQHLLGFCGGLLAEADQVYQFNLQIVPFPGAIP